jgi:hypothetical protein
MSANVNTMFTIGCGNKVNNLNDFTAAESPKHFLAEQRLELK